MKKITLLFVALLCLTNCSKKVTSLKLNDFESIERIRIGMPIDAAVKLASRNHVVEKSKTITHESEEAEYEYIVYSDKTKRETLFTFNGGYDNQNSNKVFRIVIKNSKYSTLEGISVGMGMKDLKEIARIKSADFNFEDGLFILSDKFDGGYWMDVDMKLFDSYNFEEPKINTLPESLTIKAIIIF
ncbi:MAG: hypothetical protein ACI9P5_003475 [Saprospiraceae bacterium]|jgi:hypothetical protein